MSCTDTSSLKFNVFALPKVKLTIDLACSVGNIIRCKKAFLQIYRGKIQGVMSQNSEWSVCVPINNNNLKHYEDWKFLGNQNFNSEDFPILEKIFNWKMMADNELDDQELIKALEEYDDDAKMIQALKKYEDNTNSIPKYIIESFVKENFGHAKIVGNWSINKYINNYIDRIIEKYVTDKLKTD